jgi:NAD(P)-dependent dehydrogenase (short-subunit alcohol dehydrogenase family)
MTGLIIFTGANSSLGIPAADHLLATYPGYTVVFTVRDASSSDVNTQSLRKIISKYPEAKTIIEALDLSNLSAVHAFADSIVSKVQSGQYPSIDALVCNAYYWNLLKGPEITADGFDKTFEVAHISHAALILRLLGSLSTTGRIVLLSSDSHWPGKNVNEIYPPSIPEDFDLLINPTVDSDLTGRGFQRYATAKLVLTTWSYALNRHLEKVSTPSVITLYDMTRFTTELPKFSLSPHRIQISQESQQ